ncbi:hypothetical protein FET70_03167 (plasmid) [Lactiplantibacillus plantarum]|nr:hypothetical protein FET70_03167 [Lactiplantibacillus plantarum]
MQQLMIIQGFLIFIINNTLSYNLRVFDYLHIFSIGRAVDVYQINTVTSITSECCSA